MGKIDSQRQLPAGRWPLLWRSANRGKRRDRSHWRWGNCSRCL